MLSREQDQARPPEVSYLVPRVPRSLFDAVRRRQIGALRGTAPTAVDDVASEALYTNGHASMAAINNPEAPAMRAVGLGTGVGKSTAAAAFCAAGLLADWRFTAAYVCPSVLLAIDTRDAIEDLCGQEVGLWTAAHEPDATWAELERVGLAQRPKRTMRRSEIRHHRCVVVTHQMLAAEMENGDANGVRFWEDPETGIRWPRSIVVVDEHPGLLDVVAAEPASVQHLLDAMRKWGMAHPWVPLLEKVRTNMERLTAAEPGTRFSTAPLLTPDEGEMFGAGATSSGEARFVDDLYWLTRDPKSMDDPREAWRELLQFLRSAAKGCLMYDKKTKAFISYRNVFETARCRTHLLLDATAALAGLVSLNTDVEMVAVPQVDYSRVTILHAKHPEQFHNVAKVCADGRLLAAYGRFIRDTVLKETFPGEEVLVVTHKKVRDAGAIPLEEHDESRRSRTESPDDGAIPYHDWEGRRVYVMWWGSGIGTNRLRDVKKVFLFGEWYPPASATISDYHGWSGKRPTNAHLRLAEPVRVAGGAAEFMMQGPYRDVTTGRICKWIRQLAARGACRRVDADMRAHPMTIYTTMSLKRLFETQQAMFYRSPPARSFEADTPVEIAPRYVGIGERIKKAPQVSQRDKLVALLMSTNAPFLSPEAVEEATGLLPNRLIRESQAELVAAAMQAHGWVFGTGRDLLGLPGHAGRRGHFVKQESVVKAAA